MNNFENIPISKFPKRSHIVFNSILFVIEQIEDRYNRLYQILKDDPDETNSIIISISWDIIDWCEKLRKILELGAGIKKSDTWYITIIKDLNPIENVRHDIQHFDRRINQAIYENKPVFGVVTAIYPLEGKKFSVKLFHSGVNYIENSIPFTFGSVQPKTISNPPVDHITFELNSNKINLSDLLKSVALFKKSFLDFIEKKYS